MEPEREMPTEILQRRRALYALDPADFTAARDALVRELKADGAKDAAAEIGKLRRPSVGAHALNQVAREHPELIDDALDAGVALREASRAAAEGDAGALRDATAAERAAGQAVAKAARRHLGSRGDALVPAILATLRAAALDQEVADDVRNGTLTREHEQAGFGFGLDSGDGAVAPRRATRRAAPKPASKPKLRAVTAPDGPDPDEVARDKAARAAARAAERQRKKDLAAAERNATRLEREAARLAKEADDAEAEAHAARQAADATAERAAEARRAAQALA
ncbi:MAG: hypothetical protein ACJ739_01870 [Acidimicrobiales bacterium]